MKRIHAYILLAGVVPCIVGCPSTTSPGRARPKDSDCPSLAQVTDSCPEVTPDDLDVSLVLFQASRDGGTSRDDVLGELPQACQDSTEVTPQECETCLAAMIEHVWCEDTNDTTDLSGIWTVRAAEDSSCPSSGQVETTAWEVTQTGDTLTLEDTQGVAAMTGTVSGDTLALAGSWPQDGGTSTIESSAITIGEDGLSFTGTISWRWTGEDFANCGGTTELTGTR